MWLAKRVGESMGHPAVTRDCRMFDGTFWAWAMSFAQLVSAMLWKDPKKDRAVPKNAGALHVLSIELDDRTDSDNEKGELAHPEMMLHLELSCSYFMCLCVRIRRPGSR